MADERPTWRGDTWWFTDRDCPECGEVASSNGKCVSCTECDWWEYV